MTNSPIPGDVVARLRDRTRPGKWSDTVVHDKLDLAAADLIEALHFDVGKYKSRLETVFAEKEALQRDLAEKTWALEQIAQWASAYPLKVFPEPDFEKAAKVLSEAGMTLDAISASNMRHVIEGVGQIARAAIRDIKGAGDA